MLTYADQFRDELATFSPNQKPVDVVAVTKYASLTQMHQLVDAGFSKFGESKIQDAEPKIAHFSGHNIEWHFIGRIQSNKIRKIVQHFDWIQSIDRLKVLRKINDVAKELNRRPKCLIQVNITDEAQKGGFSIDDFNRNADEIFNLEYGIIKGVMVIGLKTSDPDLLSASFKKAQHLYNEVRSRYNTVDTLSMGMSQDYTIAVQHGSTMVRIGQLLLDRIDNMR